MAQWKSKIIRKNTPKPNTFLTILKYIVYLIAPILIIKGVSYIFGPFAHSYVINYNSPSNYSIIDRVFFWIFSVDPNILDKHIHTKIGIISITYYTFFKCTIYLFLFFYISYLITFLYFLIPESIVLVYIGNIIYFAFVLFFTWVIDSFSLSDTYGTATLDALFGVNLTLIIFSFIILITSKEKIEELLKKFELQD